jgi:hypothetical protein
VLAAVDALRERQRLLAVRDRLVDLLCNSPAS